MEKDTKRKIFFREIPFDKEEMREHIEMDPDDDSNWLEDNMLFLMGKYDRDDIWQIVSEIDTKRDGLYVTDTENYDFTAILDGKIILALETCVSF